MVILAVAGYTEVRSTGRTPDTAVRREVAKSILPFEVGGAPITYNLIRRKGQKHINIRVHHDGQVTVSAPYHAGIERIDNAVRIKQRWISRHVEDARERMSGVDELKSIPVTGQMHSIKITHDPTRRSFAKIDQERSTIELRSPSRNREARKTELARFLKRHSRKLISAEVESLSRRSGIAIARVYFRDQKTRWGSSSARGNISLNWRIVLLPDKIRHYLIIHELAHQIHMNHSPRFWGRVSRLCPDYIECDRWLKEHSYVLGLFR